MFNWAKQQLANVAGTQEPIYGPSAIKSVAEEAKDTPYTELTKNDLKWQQMTSTCVETKSFYLTADNGRLGLAQVIYSNVAGIRTTCQFTCKVFSMTNKSEEHLWSSNPLSNYEISEDGLSFYAEDCALELSEDGNAYTIKSMNDANQLVNLKIERSAPGWKAGKSGKTLYGTDLENPWGSMFHHFWPRCKVEGTITTKEGPIDYKGTALFIHALQGMKPHHAAAKWNFVNFQGPEHSAIMMQFTTPPSYGSTSVVVGCVVKDGELLTAGVDHLVTHTAVKNDAENEWPEPSAVKFAWAGKTKDGKVVEAGYEGPLGERTDRVDVMAEVPGFVKKIVAGAAGTKPYIYQYKPRIQLKVKVGDTETTEEGQLFSEATFISE